MSATTYKLRLDTEQLDKWQKSAEEAGLKLAEWIRRRCDGDSGKAVRPDGDVHMVQGSPATPEGSRKPRTNQNSGKAKSEPGSIAVSVAERTKHELGCQCFQCVQSERFFRAERGE